MKNKNKSWQNFYSVKAKTNALYILNVFDIGIYNLAFDNCPRNKRLSQFDYM